MDLQTPLGKTPLGVASKHSQAVKMWLSFQIIVFQGLLQFHSLYSAFWEKNSLFFSQMVAAIRLSGDEDWMFT